MVDAGQVRVMKNNLYEDLKNEYFKLNSRKQALTKEINESIGRREEIESIMTDIECILTEHGIHIYSDFKEKEGET